LSLGLALLLASVLVPVNPASARWMQEERFELETSTLDGGSGLFRVLSATGGKAWDLRFGVHAEYFTQAEFIVANWAGCGSRCPNEQNSRFIGAVTAGFSPWKYLEVFGAIYSSSNLSERNHLEPTQEPTVQMALGDWMLGVKGWYPVHPSLTLGATFSVKILNSYGKINADLDGTNIFAGFLMSFDVRKLAAKVPLRLHLNLGYVYDRSHSLLGASPEDYTPDQYESSEKHHAFLVQQFALGLNHSRFRVGIGIDSPMPWLGGLFNPIVEVQLDVATGKPDPIIAAWDEFVGGDYNVEGRLASRLTLGVRFRPVKGLIVDAGVDIALSHQGFAMGPPLPPWNFFFGMSYAFSAKGGMGGTREVVKWKTKEVVKEVAAKPQVGRIRGTVKDAKSNAPVAVALISFPGQTVTDLATAEDGTYVTYGFKPGEVKLEVRHKKYQPWVGSAKVELDKDTPLDILLQPKVPEVGEVVGTVTDNDGKPVESTVEFEGTAKQTAQVGKDGAYTLKLKPGAYKVKASATGYFARYNAIVVNAGTKQSLEFKLTPKPRKAVVVITKRSLQILKKIHFAYNKATIQKDSLTILDEVSSVLQEHPEIEEVSIEGHTDKRGGYDFNMKLSQSRADAVRDYLIAQGIDASRLTAKGYGSSRPIVPELTPRHREINRRVEFKIVKRSN
jgi:outer membrane protein OmpA-like peptidoglycan-associated protein